MYRLLLLRHAKAVLRSPGGDVARELGVRGHAQAARLGSWLADQRIAPDAMLVSSSTRTRETAEIVVAALPVKPKLVFDQRLYLAEPSEILDMARRGESGWRTLAIVGHNPGFAELAEALTGEGDAAARNQMARKFPTCALAVLEFDIVAWSGIAVGGGRLAAFVTPKSLGARTDD